MTVRSTIMDTNSFRAENAEALAPAIRQLTDKRSKVLGESYRLFYRNPVHLVRGQGQYLWDRRANSTWICITTSPASATVIRRSWKPCTSR